MIDIDPGPGLLARFVRDLESQSPIELGDDKPDLSDATAEDIEAARLVWAARIVDEYRSVVVFSELLRLLAEARAPFSALSAVQRLVGDELRHTLYCARAVEWLGGFDDLEIDLEDMGLPPSDDPPQARALEVVVRELVVAETESVIVLRAYRDATTEPVLRRMLDVILRDEVRHAATGRELAKTLLAAFPDAATRDLRARLPQLVTDDLEHIHSIYLASTTNGPGRALGASLRPGELPLAPAQVPAVWR